MEIPVEVEEAAEHYAKLGELPAGIEIDAMRWINSDLDAFLNRVHECRREEP